MYFVCTVLHCNGNIILEKPLDFMHCLASRFGYPNYRLSELSLVPISSDNRRSTVYIYQLLMNNKLFWNKDILIIYGIYLYSWKYYFWFYELKQNFIALWYSALAPAPPMRSSVWNADIKLLKILTLLPNKWRC